MDDKRNGFAPSSSEEILSRNVELRLVDWLVGWLVGGLRFRESVIMRGDFIHWCVGKIMGLRGDGRDIG